MAKKTNQILQEVLEKAKPSKDNFEEIENSLKEFLKKLEKKVRKSKIKAEVFVGGSFAKNSMINKKVYDIDIYIRFDRKYENISKLTGKLLSGFKKTLVHGSRDYYRIKSENNIIFEVIPVIKIKKPEEAMNITDLSYFHVSYVKRKLKLKKLADDVVIAKTFCHANNCYGAESYIKGFSGYSLELLVYHYRGFLKFIKEMSKAKDLPLVIDTEKHFKNKQEILMNVNASKLQSPIIFIDPTYKQRNVLAALSDETFKKFRHACKNFLRNPSIKFFEERKVDLEKIKENASKKKFEFTLIQVLTNKQEGDIAGSKLLKFYNHLEEQIIKYFEIKNHGFEYNDKKSAKYFFVVKKRKEILQKGPKIKDKKNLKKFKRKHKHTFVKSGRIYSKEKINFNIKTFINSWKRKNKRTMKEMSIKGWGIL